MSEVKVDCVIVAALCQLAKRQPLVDTLGANYKTLVADLQEFILEHLTENVTSFSEWAARKANERVRDALDRVPLEYP